jgi:hypothetical protein
MQPTRSALSDMPGGDDRRQREERRDGTSIMIPWSEVVTIAVLRDDLYPEFWVEASLLA